MRVDYRSSESLCAVANKLLYPYELSRFKEQIVLFPSMILTENNYWNHFCDVKALF